MIIWGIRLDMFGAVWPFGPCLNGRGYADWIRPSYSKTAEQQQSLTVALKQCPLFQGIDAEVPRILLLQLYLFSCCGHVRRDGFIFFVVLCQLISGYLQIYRCNWIWALGLSGLLLFDLDVSQDLSNLVDAMEIMCCLEHQLCGYVFSGKIFERCWRIQKALSQQAHGYKQEGGDSMVWSSTWRRFTTCGCAAWFSRLPDAKV